MALATVEDVVAALGRSLTSDETFLAATLLEEASDLTIGYLGCEPDPIPDPVVRVVARMVARVLSQSGTVGSESTTNTIGPFSQTARFGAGTTSGAPWLAAADKIRLRPFRCGGGMTSVSLSSAQTGRYRRYP